MSDEETLARIVSRLRPRDTRSRTLITERRRLEKLDGKIALLRTWEAFGEPDAAYTAELRAKVVKLQKVVAR